MNVTELIAGFAVPAALISSGIYFTVKLRFFYLRHPLNTVKLMLGSSKQSGESSYRSVCLALAGTLGVGNIVGVATAIIGGGPGAVLWMIAGAMLAAVLKYGEIVLAVLFRRENNGSFYGGAMYYIKDGITKSKSFAEILAGFFAIMCVINSLTTGNLIQVNAISSVICKEYGVSAVLVAVIITATAALAIMKADKSITAVTSVLVPFASIVFILISFAVIIKNRGYIRESVRTVFECSFGSRQFASGIGGYSVSSAVRFGVTRGLVSNEAGSGTAPTAHARANTKSPAQQGLWGIFEVFADTVIMSALTALVLMIYVVKTNTVPDDSGEFVSLAYSLLLGSLSGRILGICIAVFAYATVICQYYYGMESLKFLSGKKVYGMFYTFLFFVTAVIGSFVEPEFAWSIADLSLSVMTLINIGVLIYMRRLIADETEKIKCRQKACTLRNKIKGRGFWI